MKIVFQDIKKLKLKLVTRNGNCFIVTCLCCEFGIVANIWSNVLNLTSFFGVDFVGVDFFGDFFCLFWELGVSGVFS